MGVLHLCLQCYVCTVATGHRRVLLVLCRLLHGLVHMLFNIMRNDLCF
jgi:hypothetical protein